MVFRNNADYPDPWCNSVFKYDPDLHSLSPYMRCLHVIICGLTYDIYKEHINRYTYLFIMKVMRKIVEVLTSSKTRWLIRKILKFSHLDKNVHYHMITYDSGDFYCVNLCYYSRRAVANY